MDIIQVPARVPRSVIDQVRKKMKKDNMQWSTLLIYLFHAYLEGEIRFGIIPQK